MALTPEEKKANREYFKVRDRAFSDRRDAFRKALNTAQAEFKASPEEQAYETAHAAFEAAFNQVEVERRDIENQIRALREQQEGLRAKHNIDQLADARRNAAEVRRKAQVVVDTRIAREYSDVAGVLSAADWEAKGNFSREMAATRA
jgi:hypothetical protein